RFLHAAGGRNGKSFRSHAGKPGERRSCGDSIGKAGPHSQPEGTQSADEIGHQLALASEEVRHAGDVDPKSALPIDISAWTVAPAPARQGEKRRPILASVDLARQEAWINCPGIGARLAGPNTLGAGVGIRSSNDDAMRTCFDECERT